MSKPEKEGKKRTYDQLDSHEKVVAVLASTFTPISREQAIRFSGVTYDQLDSAHRVKIDALFSDPTASGVVVTENENTPLYKLENEKGRAFLLAMDVLSVAKHMGKGVWDELVPDLVTKIQVVLGSAYGPMDRQEVLHFCGIEYDALEPATKTQIDALFVSSEAGGLIQSKDQGRTVFSLDKKISDELATQIDFNSVRDMVGTIMDQDVRNIIGDYDAEMDD